jgi:hypothetical protein
LGKGISQREINRKIGVDRKTIRKYGQEDDLEADQGRNSDLIPYQEHRL